MVIKRGIRTSKKKAKARKKAPSKAASSPKRAVRRSAASGPIRRIAICTGGGDAPGLNAVIRAAVLGAYNQGWEVVGIRDGYLGLLEPRSYPEGGTIRLIPESVRGITHLGGTILGSTNKGNPLDYPIPRADGTVGSVDRGDELIGRFKALGIDALISIGGDGSLTIANELARRGVRVVGVPKTIDNDLDKTVMTFGFDSAVNFATGCIDRLHSTAEAHRRIMVVEVMGRYAGWIALNSGIAGAADAILIPEVPYDIDNVARWLRKRRIGEGRNHCIVVVAEGAAPKQGRRSILRGSEIGQAERLGGVGEKVTRDLQSLTGQDTRHVVLGHLLRGGSPTAFDRLVSLRFGAAAIRCLAAGQHGVMVALDPPTVRHVPLAEATSRMKLVKLDSDTVMTARDLGVCLGD